MATFENKTVVVVGGSSGIGFAIALAALRSLASAVIIASSNADRVQSAVERLRAHALPGAVRGEAFDAKDAAAVKDFAVRLGEVDHITWTSGDFPEAFQGDAKSALENPLPAALSVRFWGPFILSQNAKIRPGGSLTLTTGPGDFNPRPGGYVSSAMCAAIVGLVKSLAVDMAPVRVNAVSPGGVNTEFWDKIPAVAKAAMLKDLEGQVLIKRIGEPEEIAEAFIFLMKCGYITGQRINVDGGMELA